MLHPYDPGTPKAVISTPITLYFYEKSYLFGLIKIRLHVEDRRPDLSEMTGKFKHHIYFKCFGNEISIVTRSTNGIGTYKVDGKTQITSLM